MYLAQGTKVDRYNLPKIVVVTVEELWQKLGLSHAKGVLGRRIKKAMVKHSNATDRPINPGCK
jgi:hypothetical protein